MCRAVTCSVCGRTTWAGCGRHVEQVLSSVPREMRCYGEHPATQSLTWWSAVRARLGGRM